MTQPVFILSLECPRDIARQRYLKRRDPSRPGEDIDLFELRTNLYDEESALVEQVYDRRGFLIKVSMTSDITLWPKRLLTLNRWTLLLKSKASLAL